MSTAATATPAAAKAQQPFTLPLMQLMPTLEDCSRVLLGLVVLRALNLVRRRYLAALGQTGDFNHALWKSSFLPQLQRALARAAGTFAILLSAFDFGRSPEWWEFSSLLTDGISFAHAAAGASALVVFEHQLGVHQAPLASILHDEAVRLAKRWWLVLFTAVFALNRATASFIDWTLGSIGVGVLLFVLVPMLRPHLHRLGTRFGTPSRNLLLNSTGDEAEALQLAAHQAPFSLARPKQPSCTSLSSHTKTSSSH